MIKQKFITDGLYCIIDLSEMDELVSISETVITEDTVSYVNSPS